MTGVRKHSSKASLNGDHGSAHVPHNGNNTNSRVNIVQAVRIILATIYLVLIILTIPLAFELGGINCGLSFTLTILVLYFVLTTLRVCNFNIVISSFLYYSQHLLLPSLLFLFISIFSNSNDQQNHYEDESSFEAVVSNIWWGVIIKSWRFFLINSTPLFTILEGFCSLLLIQSVGQTSKWLTRNKSETWSIVSLLVSGIVTTTATFFLFKIYVSPINLTNIGLISASLLGSVLTFTLVATASGLIMGRSNTIESALVFSYIVKSIYEIFPELSQLNYDNFQELFKYILDELYKINEEAKNKNWFLINNETHLHKLSFLLAKLKQQDSSNTVANLYQLSLKFITKNFPSSFQTLWDFLKLAVINLTLPIIMNLFYRIGVFFAATKIIPILQPLPNSQHSSPNRSPLQSAQPSPKLSPDAGIPKSSSQSSIFSLKELDDPTTTVSASTTSSNSSSSQAEALPTLMSPPSFSSPSSPQAVAPLMQISTSTSSTSTSSNAEVSYFHRPPSKTTRLIYLYSPCIIITVYTNLMIQYNNKIDDIPIINWLLKDFLNDGVHIWQFWHWVNVFLFLMLYIIELVLN